MLWSFGPAEDGEMKNRKRYGKLDHEAARRYDDSMLPSGKNCMRVRGHGGRLCDRCGTKPAVIHVPIRAKGTFCSDCCPCCALPAASIP
jgi:hypothetical protein